MKPLALSEDRKRLRELSKAFNLNDRNRFYAALESIEERLIEHKVRQEIGQRECCPIEERYLDVQEVESSTSKITINPIDGRVTLKVSYKASESVKHDLYMFAEQVKQLDNLPPITLRGRIDWHKGKYIARLQSETKSVARRIEMEG